MSRAWTWVFHLFSLEIRKVLSYRVDFWINFLGAVLTELAIAYFLWRAVFESQGATQISGYSFKSMILYYVLVALVRRTVMAIDQGAISFEIYDGSLNRYLVYPVSLFSYKYVSWMANAFVTYVQLLLSLALFIAVFGIPADRHVTLEGLVMGTVSLWAASSMYYLLSMLFEMVAFWAENVWSLLVMLRFTVALLGGALIPIALFPKWSMRILKALPFEHMVSSPIRAFMGELSWADLSMSLAILGIWSVLIGATLAWIWRRGTLKYSGVGI
jgi:ABC-2 type transport system permease protein